jgi:hypothetical protein
MRIMDNRPIEVRVKGRPTYRLEVKGCVDIEVSEGESIPFVEVYFKDQTILRFYYTEIEYIKFKQVDGT